MKVEKRFIIKSIFDKSVYARNQYNSFSMRDVLVLYDEDAKLFLTKEEAEKEIYNAGLTQVTIIEIFI